MPSVSDDILFNIKEANDIIDVISSRMSLKKAGRNYKGLCPFHSEKSPSFSVNPDRQFFHCFGCGAGGDVFTFVMKYENISFFDAVKKLADSAGITLPKTEKYVDKKKEELADKLFAINNDAADFFVSNLKSKFGEESLKYFKDRGISEDSIKRFKIGCAIDSWDSLLKHLKGKGHSEALIEKAGLIVKKEGQSSFYDRFRKRIMFPIQSVGGNVIGFGGRVLDTSLPKYLNSPDTPVFHKGYNLYALNVAKEAARKLGYLIIVEGYLDAISPFQHGIENIGATLGTALTENHIRLIKRYVKKAVLIFDPDEAGVKAVLRGLDLFLKTDMKVNVVALPEKLDPDNFVKKYGKEEFLKQLKQSVRILDFFLNYTIEKQPIRTIDDKITVVNEILPKVSMVKNRIERDHYIKKLAERLKIEENLLRQEMVSDLKGSGVTGKSSPEGALPTALRAPILNAEETLLKVMLASGKLTLKAKDIINIADLSDPHVQRVVKKMFDIIDKEGEPNADAVIKDEDENVKALISKLIVEESLITEKELERAFMESLFKVQNDSITKKMDEILVMIEKASQDNNEKLKEELLKEYVEIEKIKNKLKIKIDI
jgi:DNA primase